MRVPLSPCMYIDENQLPFPAHSEADRAEFWSPEARGDPTLWDGADNGDESCLWNSSGAESNNAWINGTRGRCDVVSQSIFSSCFAVRNNPARVQNGDLDGTN